MLSMSENFSKIDLELQIMQFVAPNKTAREEILLLNAVNNNTYQYQ